MGVHTGPREGKILPSSRTALAWTSSVPDPAMGRRKGRAQGAAPERGRARISTPGLPRSQMQRTAMAGSLLAVLACAGLAFGAPRDDDPLFALALAERGYEDLAQAEVDRMPPGENSDYTRCQLLRRTALLGAGDDRADPKVVRDKFDAARKAFDAFLKKYAGSRLKGDAELTMSELMTKFGYFLQQNLEKFDKKDRAGVQDEAAKILDESIRYLQAIKTREDERAKNLPVPTDREDDRFDERNKAWLFMCMAMHDRANLKPKGDAVRVTQFTQAIEELKLLLEETDGNVFGYHAYKWIGLCYWHRGEMQAGYSGDDLRQAKEFFSGTLDQADIPNLEQEWPGLVDLICDTAVQYGTMCNAAGNVDGVNYKKLFHDKAQKIAEKLPGIKTRSSGLQMLIEDAKAMAGIGFAEAAVTQLNQISNWASQSDPSWGRYVDHVSKQALNDVLASIPADSPLQLGPDVLMKAGEGSFNDANFGRAIRAFQRVLGTIDQVPDAEKRKSLVAQYGGQCWLRIQECYARLQRPLEAYMAADHPVQRFLSSGAKEPSEEVSDLAYFRIGALQELMKRAPKEERAEWQDRIKAAQELFTQRFEATSRQGKNVVYTVALQKLNQGASMMMAGGDQARGIALLKEAIDGFNKVDPKDPYYLFAQARIGEALVHMGKHEDALKHLNAFIAKNKADWENPVTPVGQRQPWGWAVFQIALAWDGLKQPAKVVETLDAFETRFKGASLENSFPKVRYTRASALIEVGRGAEAEREVDQLTADSPESAYASMGSLAVANDIKKRADQANKSGDKKGFQDLLKRAMKYYDFWVSRSADITSDNMIFVADLHDQVGNGDRAAELWRKALEDFRKRGDEKKVEAIIIKLAGVLVNQGKYAEALPQFETLFIKTPDDIQVIRDVFESLKRRPVNIAAEVWNKKTKDTMTRIAEVLAKDPAGAAQAGEAKRAADAANPEVLIRAYADAPELRLACARAVALTFLGTDAAMPADLKNCVFQLVKRSPDLMSNLARCYEELATASPENPIRSVNIYSTLIESAPNPDDPDAPPPGSKYSARWFGWKLHHVKVYVVTGTAYKHEGFLRTACQLVASMETLGELKRADREQQDMGKAFTALKDQADSALRGLGKDGCK
jgi:tetratricopeptide (TPR) repeat protein